MSIFSKLSKKTSKKQLEQFCSDARIFIQVHYVREKSKGKYAFNTLKLKSDPDREKCKDWYASHGNPDNFQEIARLYMKEFNISMEYILQEYDLISSCFTIHKNSFHSIEKWEAIAICFGLHLNMEHTKALLETAGYALTNSSETDLIIRFCFENNIYKREDINYILKKLADKTLEEISS
ncbi:MAG: hypothetical protein HFI34_04850 [Lachnospiraceae bacterium]|nr:hypothetical protein [Lachnospiraceae bacterium]